MRDPHRRFARHINSNDDTPILTRWRSGRRWLTWWGEVIPVVLICLTIAAATLMVDGPGLRAVVPLVWATVFAIQKFSARREYRRGWREGYETATRAFLERAMGRTPDILVRAAVRGDPTPEPWHRHIPIDTRMMDAGEPPADAP